MEINYLEGIIVIIKWFASIALSLAIAAVLLGVILYVWYQLRILFSKNRNYL